MQVDIKKWNSLAPKLLAFIRRRVPQHEIAQDIVQDVFLQYHEHGNQLKDPDKLAGWTFRIAQNRITDLYRERKRLDVLPAIPASEEENRYNQCVSNCLKEEIRNLPDTYRRAFEAAELNQIPQVKLAAEMGISYSGLKSRVQRAREFLRLRMKEKYNIEYDRYGNILVCESRRGVSCPHPRG